VSPRGRRPPPSTLDEGTDELRAAMVRLTGDLKKAARDLTAGQARYVVDSYYQIQQFRMESANNVRAAEAAGEPTEFLVWMRDLTKRMESTVKSALNEYTETLVAARWAKSITGIGPVISAGLAAHIDIRRAQTAGAIWRFAGLDPTVRWEKKQKRPWNAALKTLCWKIGESFVKVQNLEGDVYGHVYVERKTAEIRRNLAGLNADAARRILSEKDFRKDTKAKTAYERGVLPDGHIHARAKRYAVKLFLSHYHHVAYEAEFHALPPKPYIIEHGGHTHFLAPPNWPMA
jgi:hypothetical protein